jgi:DNA-binding protein YbaB
MLKNKSKNQKLTPKELGKLQKEQLDRAKTEFEKLEFETQNKEGTIKVVATGRRVLKAITLTPELLSQEKEKIEESIIDAVNQTLNIVRDANIQLTNEVARNFLRVFGN